MKYEQNPAGGSRVSPCGEAHGGTDMATLWKAMQTCLKT